MIKLEMSEYPSSKEHLESIADSDVDTLLDQEPAFLRSTRRSCLQNICWFASGLVVSGLIYALTFSPLFDRTRDSVCAAYSSRWSPVARDVEIKYDMVKYDGRFMQENIYRKSASPEVDAAWQSLGISLRPFVVPEQEAEKAGLTHSHVRLDKKNGGGYPVNLEGLHHLHCLNLLRQSLWFNYEYYKAEAKEAFQNEESILKLHVTHCLDTLRQQLMCTADTGVLGRVWYNDGTGPTPFVDFNTQHKCKNFDAIVDWARKNQMDDVALNATVEPPSEGDYIYPATP